jgi:hypothetical protein
MVKYFSIFLALNCSMILSGCLGFGSSTTPTTDASGLSKHQGLGYAISIPASWEIVDNSHISAPVHGTLELALRSTVNRRGFMNNLIILSDTLQADVAASEYVSQSMLWASREYLGLTLESEEQIKFDDGESSRLEIFHAKYNEVTEERLFMQTARICHKKVYLMTLGLENDTIADKYPQYKSLLASFTCQ